MRSQARHLPHASVASSVAARVTGSRQFTACAAALRHGPLADPGRARKQQRWRQGFAVNRTRDERRQAPMADDLAQGHWTIK